MNRFLSLSGFLSLLGACSAWAATSSVAEAEKPAYSLSTRIGLLSDFYSDSYNSNQRAGLSIRFLGEYRFSDEVSANVDLGALAVTGNSQIVYNNDYQSKQGLALAEAAFNYKPIKELALRLGALDQGKFENPILFTNGVSFPGIQQKLDIKLDRDSTLELFGEEAVPSSNELTPVPTQNNGVPGFFYGGIAYRFGSSLKSEWSSAIHAGYFQFNNLPDAVAQGSRFRGNSVVGLGNQEAAFVYNFQGLEAGLNLKWRSGAGLNPLVRFLTLNNMDADSGARSGYVAGLGCEVQISKRFSVTPSVEAFRIESDASPALYNDSGYGHNNYQGIGVQAQMQFPKEGIFATLRFASASVLQDNPYQNGFSLISLQIGRNYEIF